MRRCNQPRRLACNPAAICSNQDMKTITRLLALLPLLLAGACVRSLDPFCSDEARRPRPDLDGTWHETTDDGKIEPGRRLVFAGPTVDTTNDTDRTGGRLEVAYFQAGDAWFVDSRAGEIETAADSWWTIHVVAVHHLARLQVEGDQLRITPLDQEWLKRAIGQGDPAVAGLEVSPSRQELFSGTPAAWQSALGRLAADTNAFPARRTLVLRRAPAPTL